MNNPDMNHRLTGMAKRSLNVKKNIRKNEKICHESWISNGRFCFRSGVIEKALEKTGFSQHLTTAVIGTGGWRDETRPQNGQNPKPG
jgi:hypothetical protein